MRLLALLALAVAVALGVAAPVGRGFGAHLPWASGGLDAAKAEAARLNKPMLLVIHKTWCSACTALKPRFAASAEITALAPAFVMVEVEDDEEPKGAAYTPDGGYIPRVLFFSPAHTLLPVTTGQEKYKHYYHDPAAIAANMRSVLSSMGAPAPPTPEAPPADADL